MKQLIMAAGLAVMLTACGTSEKKTVEGENPFFAEYTTPFGVPPFDQIKFEHYKPALLQGMEEGRKEIEAIVNNPEEPTRIRLSLWMSRVRCLGRSRSFLVDRIA